MQRKSCPMAWGKWIFLVVDFVDHLPDGKVTFWAGTQWFQLAFHLVKSRKTPSCLIEATNKD